MCCYIVLYFLCSDKNPMHFGAIVCCMGVRYRSYCSNICRTFMVNPTDQMQKNYEFLLQVYEKVINKLQVRFHFKNQWLKIANFFMY